jgi:cytochrome c556
MKKIFFAGVLTALLATGILLAQVDSEYQAWMKSNGAAMGSLNKNLMAKDASGVAADAQKLEGNLKQVAEYWHKKGIMDAMDFAMKGQMAAAAIAKDAAAGNLDQAATDLKMLQGACGGCHMAHREGTAQTGFKMK